MNLYSKTTEEDAVEKIGSDSFKIDTARYQLSDNVRAFGIRFQTSERGPSCADYLFENRQTLYIPEKNTLRPVLDLYMHTAQALNGCIGSSTNNNIIEDSDSSILIEKNKSNNFYNLKVISYIEPFAEMDNPPSDINIKPRTESYQFKYNGKQYMGGDKKTPWWIYTLNE